MARKARAPKAEKTALGAYFFSPGTKVAEPAVPAAERRRYDELGVIGTQELTDKGFYAAIARGAKKAAAKPPVETTVLVVEDDAGTTDVITRVLGTVGYRTRAAANRAQIAEEFGRTPPPDLILMDVDLAPGLSGFDILNRLRQHALLGGIPVIMVTSMNAREHIVRGLSLGADGYLTKPARPSALVDAVRAVLE
jgi:CheY-like chemotaxis protein